MDFTLNDEQQAIVDLTSQILADHCSLDELKRIEAAGTWFAESAWKHLAAADVLGLCLPADVGGGGYGFLEACLVLEQVGRHVAPVPFWATVVLGALPIAEFGTAAQRAALLPGVASGEVVLTAALAEHGADRPATRPSTSAARRGDGWTISGSKRLVTAADLAHRMLVPATTDVGTAVFLVDPSGPGVTLDARHLTNNERVFDIELADAPGEMLGDSADRGDEIVAWITDRAVAGLCAIQSGLCAQALKLTADYVSSREQFGVKIASFQAVGQRAADAYVDTEAVSLTARQAAWRLSEGLDAADAIDIAKYWASIGGYRVMRAAQHLHGGIGVDLDYPLHRYYRWSKVVELTLGGATPHLHRLGRRLAAG